MAPCEDPADLPAGAMSAGAVERVIAHDRSELILCKAKHAAITKLIPERDARLAGKR